jgi:hypothetical protein
VLGFILSPSTGLFITNNNRARQLRETPKTLDADDLEI